MRLVLAIVQLALGAYFAATGVVHFLLPPGLPAQMSWMYDLGPVAHYAAGAAEVAGGLGLLIALLRRGPPWLASVAGGGLVLVMLGAAGWHLTRGEAQQIVMNVVLGALLAIVTLARWRSLPARAAA